MHATGRRVRRGHRGQKVLIQLHEWRGVARRVAGSGGGGEQPHLLQLVYMRRELSERRAIPELDRPQGVRERKLRIEP